MSEQPVSVPRWVVEGAITDHLQSCSYCSADRSDLCRDGEYLRALQAAVPGFAEQLGASDPRLALRLREVGAYFREQAQP